ncbi:MAG: amidohydrolase [Clostridiales bacterium]|nr:amidohydrolase [Clostridiales bacterium]MCF8022602.1 amidohydrolase [Clostridiales bacterium]
MSRLLIKADNLITMDNDNMIINGGEIAVEGNRIIHVGPQGSSPADFKPEKVVGGDNMLAMPGFVNCHTHASMTLLRSYADDLPLMKWLQEKIWPFEDNMTAEDNYWGAMLCCLEMIKSGTTAFADMYMHMERAAEAVKKTGMRASLSRGLIGIAPHGAQALEENRDFVREYNGAAGGRINCMFGPHAPYTCPPEYIKQVIEYAGELGTGIHIHLAETQTEYKDIYDEYGKTSIQLMDSIGLFELPVIAAHCVHLDDADIKILADKKAGIAHCPESNMKLASGIAPVKKIMESGAVVGLGTDGASSNNNLDMLEELHCATLLQKVDTKDPTALPACEVLTSATKKGAEVLGLQQEIGMLKPGYKADLILINMNKPHLRPLHNPMAHIAYAASSSDIDTTIVDGQVLMENRRVLTIDEDEVYGKIDECTSRLLSEAAK